MFQIENEKMRHYRCMSNTFDAPELPKEEEQEIPEENMTPVVPAVYSWYQLNNDNNVWYNINSTWGKKIGYCNAANE